MLATTRLLELVSSILLSLLFVGCGGSQDSVTDREQQLEQYAQKYGVNVDVAIDEETNAVVLSHEGGTKIGKGIKLPENFPRDVSLYPGMVLMMASPVPNGIVLMGQSNDDGLTVGAFYKREMQKHGWSLKSNNNTGLAIHALQFSKGMRVASVTIIPAENATNIQLSTMTLTP